MPLSWAAERFAFLVSRRDRAPEKRKVGGSTPPLTTRLWASASPLTCRNRRKRAEVLASFCGLANQDPHKTHNYGASEPFGLPVPRADRVRSWAPRE